MLASKNRGNEPEDDGMGDNTWQQSTDDISKIIRYVGTIVKLSMHCNYIYIVAWFIDDRVYN